MLGIKQSLREGTYPFSIGDDSRRGPYGLLRESVKFQDGHINQALSPMTGLCFFFSLMNSGLVTITAPAKTVLIIQPTRF
jgi:hypothetical protein